MAELLGVGSRSYKILLGLWLATTLLLVGLLFPVGTSAADTIAPDNVERLSRYNSTRYANVLWSAVDTRVTESDFRDCNALPTCKDVVVVENIVTNLGSNISIIDSADLALLNRDGKVGEAQRFDCAGRVHSSSEVFSLLGVVPECAPSSQRINLNPGESLAVSVLFFVDAMNSFTPSDLTMEIVESHRSTVQPASLNLGHAVELEPYPAAGVLASSKQVVEDDAVLELDFAIITLNDGNQRAEQDMAWVIVRLASSTPGDFDRDDFSLQSDGDSVAPVEVRELRSVDNSFEVIFQAAPIEGTATLEVLSDDLSGKFDLVFRTNRR